MFPWPVPRVVPAGVLSAGQPRELRPPTQSKDSLIVPHWPLLVWPPVAATPAPLAITAGPLGVVL